MSCMFYNILYSYLDNILYHKNNNNLQEDKNKICVICLENNKVIFYNYHYINNNYIHFCKCEPEIHYDCFMECYKVKQHCIICKMKIKKKIKNRIYYVKVLKISFLFFILYKLFFSK